MPEIWSGNLHTLVVILLVAGLTFMTRALPFWVFRQNKQPPALLSDLNRLLPPAVIAILLVFCLKDVSWLNQKESLYQLLCVVLVMALHVWKKNNLLSIGLGTAAYMLLVQLA
jgi:branched-subunit amino acid transport protein AzlD